METPQTPLPLEEQLANTRAAHAAMKDLPHDQKIAAAWRLKADFDAGRAAPLSRAKELKPKKISMDAAKTAIRRIVFGLAHEEGLTDDLRDAVEDLCAYRGEPQPESHGGYIRTTRFTNENAALAAEMVIEKRSWTDPWLHDHGPYAPTSRVWEADFETPPGLVIVLRGEAKRTWLLQETGAFREIRATRPDLGTEDRFLVPVEIIEWMDANNI